MSLCQSADGGPYTVVSLAGQADIGDSARFREVLELEAARAHGSHPGPVRPRVDGLVGSAHPALGTPGGRPPGRHATAGQPPAVSVPDDRRARRPKRSRCTTAPRAQRERPEKRIPAPCFAKPLIVLRY